MKSFNQQIETLRLETQLLETEVTNYSNFDAKKEALVTEKTAELVQVKKQCETLQGLKKALNV